MEHVEIPPVPLSIPEWNVEWAGFSALSMMAVLCIIVGAHRSLSSDAHRKQSMSSSQASFLPIAASFMLGGLFIAIKVFGQELLNKFLGYYFLLFTVAGLYYFFVPIFFGFRPLALVLAVALSAAYFWTRHWVLNDILGIALAITALEIMQLPSFSAGVLLLSGLFVFDIFWVFGSSVMVSVATKIDGPIKLVVPTRPFNMTVDDAGKRPMDLLGLGDIVVPGVFLALLLQVDVYMARNRRAAHAKPIYFGAGVIAYAVALLLTVIIGLAMKHGQPALLYLVPACLFTPIVLAFVRGEAREVFSYVAPEIPEEPTGQLTYFGHLVEFLGFDPSAFRVSESAQRAKVKED